MYVWACVREIEWRLKLISFLPAAGTNAASNLPSKIPGGLVTKGTSNLGYEKVRIGGTGQTPFPFPPQGMFGGMGALGGMGSMGFFPGMAGMPQHSLNPAQLFRKCIISAGFICWLERLKFVGCTAHVTLSLLSLVLSVKSFGMAFLVSLFLVWFLGNRSDVRFKFSVATMADVSCIQNLSQTWNQRNWSLEKNHMCRICIKWISEDEFSVRWVILMDEVLQGLIFVVWCEGVRFLVWRCVRWWEFLSGLLTFVEPWFLVCHCAKHIFFWWSHWWTKGLQMLCGSEVRLLVLHVCLYLWCLKLLRFLFSSWNLQRTLKFVTTHTGILARMWGMLQWIVTTVLL